MTRIGHLFEKSGVFNGVGDLIGHGLIDGNIFERKSSGFLGLDGHDADRASLVRKRQQYFRSCLRKEVITGKCAVFPFVKGDMRLTIVKAPADE